MACVYVGVLYDMIQMEKHVFENTKGVFSCSAAPGGRGSSQFDVKLAWIRKRRMSKLSTSNVLWSHGTSDKLI